VSGIVPAAVVIGRWSGRTTGVARTFRTVSDSLVTG